MTEIERLQHVLEQVVERQPQKVTAHLYGCDVSEVSRLKKGCALMAKLLAAEGLTVRPAADAEATERALYAQLKRRFEGAE